MELREMSREGRAELGRLLEMIQAKPGTEEISFGFTRVPVNKPAALKSKRKLAAVLKRHYPSLGRLRKGPSYVEVGYVIGDQTMALALFAIGEVLGLWKTFTMQADGSPWITDVIL